MKNIVYTAIIIVLAALQTTVFNGIKICGANANLLLAFTVLIALSENQVYGGIYGLVCGVVADSLSGGGFGYCSFVFMYSGVLSGILKDCFFRLDAFVVMLFAFAASFFNDFIFYVFAHLIWNSGGFVKVFFTKILLSAFLTAAAAAVFYGLRKYIYRRLEMKGNRRRYGF